MEIKSSEQILNESYGLFESIHECAKYAMRKYAAQFIDLAAEEAEATTEGSGLDLYASVDKESILILKQQIK